MVDLDQAGVTMATVGETSGDNGAEQVFTTAERTVFATSADAEKALLAGEVDACVVSAPEARFLVFDHPQTLDIAVAAPESMQPGIAGLVRKLAESGSAETRQVRIRQWLIEGSPAEQITVPENLASLETELRDLATAAGNMAFERLDTSQHIVLDGKHSNLTSKLLNSSLHARIEADHILADVSASAPRLGRVNTEFSVDSGQSLVLAQLGKPDADGEDTDKLIIFVFQAEIL